MSSDAVAESWRDVTRRDARSHLRGLALSNYSAWMRLTGQMTPLLRRPRVQVLILHHLFPDEEDNFRELLRRLSRDHTFISYGDAVRRADLGGDQVDRPYLTFTFDDGFKNCLRAATILEEFNARACFFICPSIVGETDLRKISAFCCDQLELPSTVEFMNWEDLKSLRDAGHDIGGHTMTHPNLAKIPPSQAEDEINQSFRSIQERLGECRHFAWTYGHFSDCSPQVVNMVYRAGYTSCASGERGCHGPRRSDRSLPLCVRRDHIVAGWPINHSLYLLARSSRSLLPEMGEWPKDWRAEIAPRAPSHSA